MARLKRTPRDEGFIETAEIVVSIETADLVVQLGTHARLPRSPWLALPLMHDPRCRLLLQRLHRPLL
jgi:hypothetical protein